MQDKNHVLHQWQQVKLQLDELKQTESALRKEVLTLFFGDQECIEGTLTVPLGMGWTLKATYGLDRKVDFEAMTQMGAELRDFGIDTEQLVSYEPKLQLRAYRALTDEQRQLFDSALVIKDKSPQLSLVEPKQKDG